MTGALQRYRIAAYTVGVLLIIACVSSVVKHVFDGPDFVWVWMPHGFVYMIYLVLAFDLFRRTRWPARLMVEMLLAGLLPGLTFVIERRVHRHAVSTGVVAA